jgi:ribonuclease BN (tRNA processing enzyme)
MKITVLGTGCIWTKRACASYLVDDNILVDAGSGTTKQLFKTSKNLLHHEKIGKLKLILITHFHLDHYFDIVPLLWKLASDKYPEMSATIVCPPDGEKKIKQLCRLGLSDSSYKKLKFKKYIKFVDASTMGSLTFGDYEISSLKMDHGEIACYGYIFKDKKTGKSVSFTGDSKMCDSMQFMIDNTDLAFVDMAGTDISNKHFNIIDGIELMKQYEGKCNIVPCHLTSQALDYCEGRIEAPNDLMVLKLSDKTPYDFQLKDDKMLKKKPELQFDFARKRFEKLEGKMVNLVLKETKFDDESMLPTYVFSVELPKTQEVVGDVEYLVALDDKDLHIGNVELNLKKDLDLRSVKYDCCKLIQQVAKSHNAKSLNLTCAPDDFDTRRVFDSLGAYLKEIKTFTHFDETGKRKLVEKCVWVWEF